MRKSLTKLLVILTILSGTAAMAEDLDRVTEDLFLMASECKTVLVELRSGKLVTVDGETYSVMCSPAAKTGYQLNCNFLYNDKTNRMITFQGGLRGQEMVLSAESDTFIVNLTSGYYYSESGVIIDRGLLRGKKVCSGMFRWDHEIKAMDKKEKEKKKTSETPKSK